MAITSPYIEEKWHDNIRNFKYKGSDNSIFYKFFTGPACDFLVRFLPNNLS